ncbi:MAG: hypothetical protein ACRC0V_06870, partial [Fusobacteriaceae bacterium]
RFLIGQGFENESINSIVVGQDSFGKKIKIIDVLRYVCKDISIYQGFTIHSNFNLNQNIVKVKPMPFKGFRLTKKDDTGYISKIAFSENWSCKNSKDINEVFYDLYNSDSNVFNTLISNNGGIDTYKGQIYYNTIDKQYIYPLSLFHSVYLDADNEYQLSLFKNRQLRNGFLNKIIFKLRGGTDAENQELNEKVKSFMGVDSDTALVLLDEINDSNSLEGKNSFITEKIETNIQDGLFEKWQTEIINNIRKAARNIPQDLFDFENSKLGTTSGEAISQSVAFYNAMTKDDRAFISNCFRELFSNFDNEILANNENWEIAEISLSQDTKKNTIKDKRAESQAVLRGSVGGVQAILQIQQSVSQGLTDGESAIAILQEIFGVSKKVAEQMIGSPKPIEEIIEETNTQNPI